MTPVEALLTKLFGVRKAGKGWVARCPAHDDGRAGLSVSGADDGTVLIKCHAGCDASAIVSALGLSLADLFCRKVGPTPNRNGKRKSSERTWATANDVVAELELHHGKRSALWTYH